MFQTGDPVKCTRCDKDFSFENQSECPWCKVKLNTNHKRNAPIVSASNAIYGGIGVAVLIIFKFGAKIAVMLGVSTGITSAKVEHSRFEDWNAGFKKMVVELCTDAEIKNDKDGYNTLKKAGLNVNSFYNNTCNCFTEKLEAAHIVHTKYSKYKGKDEFLKQFIQEYNTYYRSPEGVRSMESCAANAYAEATKQSEPERTVASEESPDDGPIISSATVQTFKVACINGVLAAQEAAPEYNSESEYKSAGVECITAVDRRYIKKLLETREFRRPLRNREKFIIMARMLAVVGEA